MWRGEEEASIITKSSPWLTTLIHHQNPYPMRVPSSWPGSRLVLAPCHRQGLGNPRFRDHLRSAKGDGEERGLYRNIRSPLVGERCSSFLETR